MAMTMMVVISVSTEVKINMFKTDYCEGLCQVCFAQWPLHCVRGVRAKDMNAMAMMEEEACNGNDNEERQWQ